MICSAGGRTPRWCVRLPSCIATTSLDGARALTLISCTPSIAHDQIALLLARSYWWEPVALLQRTTLTGWLLLFDPSLGVLRLLVACTVSIGFLIITLGLQPYKRKLDYILAAGCQILFVCSFLAAMLVELYQKVTLYSTVEAAYRYLGIHSADGIMNFMIACAFVMLVLFALTLASELYAYYVQQSLKKRWSVCTMDPPYVRWKLNGSYACFISHYKMGAQAFARSKFIASVCIPS